MFYTLKTDTGEFYMRLDALLAVELKDDVDYDYHNKLAKPEYEINLTYTNATKAMEYTTKEARDVAYASLVEAWKEYMVDRDVCIQDL